jgi:hypothetical protein
MESSSAMVDTTAASKDNLYQFSYSCCKKSFLSQGRPSDMFLEYIYSQLLFMLSDKLHIS